ncbi:MAG: hypothetical protein AAF653_13825 [Chloroflexota bacterium]
MQPDVIVADSTENLLTFCLHNYELETFYRVSVDRRWLKLNDDGEYVATVRLKDYPDHPTVNVYFDRRFNSTRAYISMGPQTMRGDVVPCEQFTAYWNDRLMAALGFTDADYKANAAGNITDAQYDIMYDRLRQSNKTLWALGGVVVVLLVVFALTVRLETDMPYWFVAGVFMLSFVLLFLGEIRTRLAVQRAMRREQLNRVTGRVRLFMQTSRTKNGKSVRSYGMRVGRKRLDNITMEVHAAMVGGETYDVHWLPGTHRILSARLLE